MDELQSSDITLRVAVAGDCRQKEFKRLHSENSIKTFSSWVKLKPFREFVPTTCNVE